jgi:glycosyltransferase involved in cell wall biosynthesis
MNPLISVIVPVYGVEAYLERCVDSLRAQTYENLEIILVDDGSKDRCPQICDACSIADPRIRVIHQENAGLSGARNSGIEIARGEYLAFVDSDDYVAPDFIYDLYTMLQETGCAIGQCRFAYVHGEPLKQSNSSQVWIYRGKSLMEQLYGPEEEATCFVVAWNKLYRRELFEEIRYPLGKIHEDEATTYRLFDKGQKLAFLDRPLYGYFMENSGSITSAFSLKRLHWLDAHEERIRYFLEHGYEELLPKAYRKLCDGYITFYFRCGEQMDEPRAVQKELMERFKTCHRKGRSFIGKLPMQTRIGYRIFRVCPSLYRHLLKRMQEAA